MSTADFLAEKQPSPNTRWKVVLGVLFLMSTSVWLVISLLTNMSRGPNAYSLVMFGLTTFLCAMLGFWAGLGTVRWRWIVIAIISPLMGIICGYRSGSSLEFQFYCLSIIGIVALTTSILRWWKGSLQVVTDREERADALQFGIKDIFIWTTAVAVFLGIGRFVMNYFYSLGISLNQGSDFLLIFALALSISVAIIVNIWAMLGNQLSVLKTITLIIVTLGAMVASYRLIPAGYFFANVTLAAQLLILFAMFVLRMQGLRFVKPNRQ